jgi:hypothetical protein
VAADTLVRETISSGLVPVRKRNMFEILKSMLTGQNAFGVYLRAVPERLWRWIVGQTTMMITVKMMMQHSCG